jgi:hypothetical protein
VDGGLLLARDTPRDKADTGDDGTRLHGAHGDLRRAHGSERVVDVPSNQLDMVFILVDSAGDY